MALLDRIAFPPSVAGGSTRCRSMSAIAATSRACIAMSTAGPNRTEEMSGDVADLVLNSLSGSRLRTLDITGGAPELNPHFRRMVTAARDMGVRVMDRCNLTIFEVEGQEDLRNSWPISRSRSWPRCPAISKTMSNASAARACSTARSADCRRLNALGYGDEASGLVLNLVYNPQGPSLPPPQVALEADYKRVLGEQLRHPFNRLYTLANMPIQRFGSMLISKGQFDDYLALLQNAHLDANLDGVMCRSLISVDYRGYVYDCDFNQMLDLPLGDDGQKQSHLSEPARPRYRRQSDPRRRALLWLHRRARLELRRRTQGSGGMNFALVMLKRRRARQRPAGCARLIIAIRPRVRPAG